MTLHVRKLTLSAFRSFRDETTLTLPEKGLMLIRGPSGAGKSSLLLGLAHAFGYSPFPATELQSWLTDQKMRVQVDLTTDDGNEISLIRGSNPGLLIGGKLTKGASQVESIWNGVIGLPPALLKALTYRGQRQDGLFLSLSDEAKKAFLSQLLGLEELEAIVESSRERAKALEATLTKHRTSIDSYRLAVETAHQGLTLVEPLEPIDLPGLLKNQYEAEERMQALEAEYQAAVTAKAQVHRHLLDSVKEELEAKAAVDYKRHLEEEASLNEKLRLIQERLELVQQREAKEHSDDLDKVRKYDPLIEQLRAQGNRHGAIVNELQQASKKLEALAQNTCPTCQQTWHNHASEVAKLKARLVELQDEVDTCRGALIQLPVLEAERNEAYRVYSEYKPSDTLVRLRELQETTKQDLKNASLTWLQNRLDNKGQLDKAEHQNLQVWNRIKEGIDKEYQELIIGATRLATALGNTYVVAKAKADNHGRLMAAYEAQLKSIANLESLLASEVVGRNETESLLNAERDFTVLIGREGFLGSIFDEVLQEISAEANNLLLALPNTQTTTVQFVSESETAKGTTKRRIVPVITKGGRQIPLQSGLSGGQLTSVELAVDLAIGKIVSRRTGKCPGWLILDETFNGHNRQIKEACLEVLRRAAQDRLILIVDHSAETEDMFDSWVDVENVNEVSFIKEH